MNLIPNDIREKVIQLWLRGEVRKEIAVTCGIGEGTVSNIVDDWKRNQGNADADVLRELAVNLKRCGINGTQCSEGKIIEDGFAINNNNDNHDPGEPIYYYTVLNQIVRSSCLAI